MQINYATNGFWRPRNVMVTKNGDIYVANTGKWNIYHFNARGAMMGKFIELYGEVFGLATDTAGRIYVADLGGRTIDILAPDLTLLKRRKVPAWRNGEGTWPMLAMDSKNRIYCVSQDLRIENRKLINKVWKVIIYKFRCMTACPYSKPRWA
jgi:sugar lactone lactonase YvrE